MVDFSKGYPRKHSFTGPGTKLHKRLNPDDSPKEWSKPLNKVDQSAYYHDLAYRDADDVENRHIADRIMLQDMDNIINDNNSGWHEKKQAQLVKRLIGAKVRFGMGGVRHLSGNPM